MAVSPGSLDSLLNTSYPIADYTSVSAQSETGAALTGSGTFTYSTITINTTGVVGPGAVAGEVMTIVGVNDTDNSVTYSLTLDGQSITQLTEYVVGYNADGILLSALPYNDFVLTAAGTISTLNNIVGVLSPSPIAAGTSLTFTPTGSSPSTPPAPPALTVLDTTTGQSLPEIAQPYSGPVTGLTSELVVATSDNLNVTVTTPNWFIHTGSGNDAIAASSGTNVLDGSTGSNFLTGGSGDDTFFVDDRDATASIWSTLSNFHSGDSATIWGVTPGDFNLTWLDGQGAAGYTGLTLGVTSATTPDATLTLAGYTSADLTNGKLAVSYGTTAASGGVAGSAFMYIHAT